MFKINTNKGVSPLIATILLVAVSLSLAGILYSWASQNAGDTINSVTETSKKWDYCKGITLNMEYGCRYDSKTGISFILYDNSTVDFDENIIISIIDANNNIGTATVTPNFQGRAMVINNTVYSESETQPLTDLTEPLQLVKVYMNGCPDRTAQTRSCD
jgi:flagellin-like protein